MKNLYKINIGEIWRYLLKEDLVFWLINLYLFIEYVRPQSIYPVVDIVPETDFDFEGGLGFRFYF